jgi:small neutral amino acid transporter SnatA (MarC family)
VRGIKKKCARRPFFPLAKPLMAGTGALRVMLALRNNDDKSAKGDMH